MKYLQDTYEHNGQKEPGSVSFANALEEQLKVDSDKLDCISGYALDYIGRLLCLLYQRYVDLKVIASFPVASFISPA